MLKLGLGPPLPHRPALGAGSGPATPTCRLAGWCGRRMQTPPLPRLLPLLLQRVLRVHVGTA